MMYSRGFVLTALVLLCRLEALDMTNADSGYGPPQPQSLNSHYGVPSHSESLIAQLRHRIADLGLDSFYTNDKQLARYIESSNYDIDRAARLLDETAQWRRSTGADDILKSHASSFLSANFPYELTGYTDEGNPVFYLPIGRWNFYGVRHAGFGHEIRKYFDRLLEELRNSIKGRVNPKTGEPVDQVVLIENLDGYTLKNLFTIHNNHLFTILRFLRNIDSYYPFLLKRYIVLNSPLAFQAGWPVYRITTPRLRKVFKIYNRFSFRAYDDLYHTVPKRAIPVELGGSYTSLVSLN